MVEIEELRKEAGVCEASRRLSLIQLLDKVDHIICLLPIIKSLQKKQIYEEDRLDKFVKKQDRFLTQLNVDMEFDKLKERIEITVERKISQTLFKVQESIKKFPDKKWVEDELAMKCSEN